MSPNVQIQKLRHRGKLQTPRLGLREERGGPWAYSGHWSQRWWSGREEEEQAPYLSEGQQVLLLLLQVPLALLDELIHGRGSLGRWDGCSRG